jgi:hypothetical protein
MYYINIIFLPIVLIVQYLIISDLINATIDKT